MISYKPLLKLLVDRDLKKRDLISMADLSKATLAKISKDEHVSMDVIERLCFTLECQPGDIIEYVSGIGRS